MRGFLTTDFAPLYEQAIADLVKWIRDGRLRYREDMLDGIESAPGSIEKLYSGANSGKLIIRL
jgi:NADPH-dependent curcumin reductase